MELIFALVVIVLIALVDQQYFNKDVDELDGSGKPVHGQSPSATINLVLLRATGAVINRKGRNN